MGCGRDGNLYSADWLSVVKYSKDEIVLARRWYPSGKPYSSAAAHPRVRLRERPGARVALSARLLRPR